MEPGSLVTHLDDYLKGSMEPGKNTWLTISSIVAGFRTPKTPPMLSQWGNPRSTKSRRIFWPLDPQNHQRSTDSLFPPCIKNAYLWRHQRREIWKNWDLRNGWEDCMGVNGNFTYCHPFFAFWRSKNPPGFRNDPTWPVWTNKDSPFPRLSSATVTS